MTRGEKPATPGSGPAGGAHAYHQLGEQGHVAILRPVLAELMGELAGRTVLDFGCGPGRLSIALAELGAERVVAMDRKPAMLAEAERVIAEAPVDIRRRIALRAGDEQALLGRGKCADALADEGPFDHVLSSLALMKSPTLAVLRQTAAGLLGVLGETGSLLLVVTHPCFRHRGFATFHYELPEDYEYWASGTPYEVVLHPEGESRRAILTDFHWSLEHYVGAITSAGAVITALRELPASMDPSGAPVGPPAYLVVRCQAR